MRVLREFGKKRSASEFCSKISRRSWKLVAGTVRFFTASHYVVHRC
jgi:hypothetical protein